MTPEIKEMIEAYSARKATLEAQVKAELTPMYEEIVQAQRKAKESLEAELAKLRG